MKLELYYSPGACSFAAHVVLREVGLPFELRRVAIAQKEHLTAEYLAINPRGRVPTLMVDGQPVRELSGILTWLALKTGMLFPAPGTLNAARCSEWLAWLTSSLHITFALIWRPERFVDETAIYPALQVRGFALVGIQFNEIESVLAGRKYALGDQYTVVDPNLLVFYRWGSRIGFNMREEFPVWTHHTELLLQRLAVREAIEAEGIDIWPAADENFAKYRTMPRMDARQLKEFGTHWAEGDVEGLMAMMAEGCEYSASVGPEPGEKFRGTAAVRMGFHKMIDHDAGAVRVDGPTWMIGDTAFGLWEFHFPAENGKPARVVRGIDRFEMRNGRIAVKDAYRKCER